jgi:death-on-curing protein
VDFRDVVFLEVEQVEAAHAVMIRAFGGSHGVRDPGLLRSAVMAPQCGYYGTLAEMASAYAFGLSSNHAFIDGNKRIAVAAAGAFLGANRIDVDLTDPIWHRHMLELAAGTLTRDDLTKLLAREMFCGDIAVTF